MSTPPLLRCALCFLLLILSCSPVLAADLHCGSYRDPEGNDRLQVETPTHAVLRRADQPDTHYLLRHQGDALDVADLTYGVSNRYTLEANGKVLRHDWGRFELETSATCGVSPPPPPGSCRADIRSCIDSAANAPLDRLRAWCGEDLPFACERLLTRHRAQARDTVAPLPDLTEPEECKQDSPAHDPAACKAKAQAALGGLMASAFAGLMGPDPALPAAPLDELQQLCRAHPGGGFCGKVAKELWTAGRYLPARDTLQLACQAGESDACAQAEALAPLQPSSLAGPAARQLPCGDYVSRQGLMSEFSFGDRGLVAMAAGGQMRARLENGRVLIRHDKGDDFVLLPLANGQLLGIDAWTRYAYYQRTGGAATCAAPVAYVEIPLPMDCPIGTDPQVCCTSGKLQGCNALGHQRALAGDWAGAAPHYRQVCAAGVRTGCENLRSVYGHTADPAIPGQLQALCDADGKGTHVACDLQDSTDWDALALSAELTRLGDALENEIEAGLGGTGGDASAPADAEKPAADPR